MKPGDLPVETFRVRPFAGRADHFIVHVADDVAGMRLAMRVLGARPKRHQIAACVAYRSRANPHLWGVLFFAKTRLGAGVVSHELAHAAFRVVEREGYRVEHWADRDPRSSALAKRRAVSSEERFCYALQRLTTNFWTEAYLRGVVAS